jgi:alkylated DNA repair dioxygenase AlkB
VATPGGARRDVVDWPASMQAPASTHALPLGGSLRFEPAWLEPAEADGLFRELRERVPWAQGTLTLFGRAAVEPRLTAWFGDGDYTYSGRTMTASPWPPSLSALRARVELAAEAPMNAALLNLYRDGRDSMGLHSDDEPELGAEPVIASVSLGATRRFILEPRRKADRDAGTHEVALHHGSLLVMAGPCQRHYRHRVPKEPACVAERINLTFRRVLTPRLP